MARQNTCNTIYVCTLSTKAKWSTFSRNITYLWSISPVLEITWNGNENFIGKWVIVTWSIGRTHKCTLTSSLSSHGIPDVAVEVIIPSKQKSAWFTECNWCYATDNVIMRVHSQFLVCPDVKQAACGIIRARSKRMPIRKELKTEQYSC